MQLPLRIALRYIFTRRSFNFITVITFISIVGITVGVAAIICVMSIFNGFRELTEKQIVGFDPHLRIQAEGASQRDMDSILRIVRNEKETVAAALIMQGRVLLYKGTNLQVLTLNCVGEKDRGYLSDIARTVIIGSFNNSGTNELPGIVLGAGLGERLRAMPGDTVVLMSPRMLEGSIRSYSMKAGVRCIVTGLFQSNTKNYDEGLAFSSDKAGKRLFEGMSDGNSFIDVRLGSLGDVERVKSGLMGLLPKNVNILTWQDLNRNLFDVMRFERMAAFIILSLIILIAVFNVLASLSLTVVEKRRDIGILKAIGATDSLIRRIFVFEGVVIGIISTLVGCIIGLTLCFGQGRFGWLKIDNSKFDYLIKAIPVSVQGYDVVLVCAIALILAFCATIYPSMKAAQTVISETIREE